MKQFFGNSLTFAIAMAAGMALLSGNLQATKKYADETKQKCVYCHTKMGSKELNDVGKCYKTNNHSLDKCKAPSASIDKVSAYVAQLDMAASSPKGR